MISVPPEIDDSDIISKAILTRKSHLTTITELLTELQNHSHAIKSIIISATGETPEGDVTLHYHGVGSIVEITGLVNMTKQYWEDMIYD